MLIFLTFFFLVCFIFVALFVHFLTPLLRVLLADFNKFVIVVIFTFIVSFTNISVSMLVLPRVCMFQDLWKAAPSVEPILSM